MVSRLPSGPIRNFLLGPAGTGAKMSEADLRSCPPWTMVVDKPLPGSTDLKKTDPQVEPGVRKLSVDFTTHRA